MWGGFVIKKIYVVIRENYGRQKMNIIIHIKEKLKELDFENSLW